jgi:hypothetical protein
MAAMSGGMAVDLLRAPKAIGEVRYRDRAPVERECADFLRIAADFKSGFAEAFMTAPSPGIIAAAMLNEHYPSQEAYVMALADALRVEYEAIVAQRMILQIDAPDLAMERHVSYADRPLKEFQEFVELIVARIYRALEKIPCDRVRLHVCWGNYEGPHDHDVALADILPILLKAQCGVMLMSMANPRYEHEYRCFAGRHFPADMILLVGAIDSTTTTSSIPRWWLIGSSGRRSATDYRGDRLRVRDHGGAFECGRGSGLGKAPGALRDGRGDRISASVRLIVIAEVFVALDRRVHIALTRVLQVKFDTQRCSERRATAFCEWVMKRRLTGIAGLLLLLLISNQAAAATAISKCGKMITVSGSYALKKNLVVKNGSGSCITINTSHVTLDLGGYNIQCGGAGGPGIYIGAGYGNITIRYGFIANCSDGILTLASSGVLIDEIISLGNSGSGITLLGSNNTITRSIANNNGLVGFQLNCPDNFIDNTAVNNAPSNFNDISFTGTGCNFSCNAYDQTQQAGTIGSCP